MELVPETAASCQRNWAAGAEEVDLAVGDDLEVEESSVELAFQVVVVVGNYAVAAGSALGTEASGVC